MSKSGEYRFALYGRTGSGKTCVLATIEMGAIGHSRKLSCDALPVEVARPVGDSAAWSAAERESAGLHAGKDWIVGAVGKLKTRELPEPNPPGGVTLAYRFQVGAPHRGNSVIHTFDYAGELVNPDGLKEPESLAAHLKRDLELYDGFVLVAETPRESLSDTIRDELTRLKQAFAALTQSKLKLQTPVAILLTKWDRYSTVDPKQPDLELDRLKDFLADDRHAGHRSLVDSIATALVPQVDIKDVQAFGLTFGNCTVFPSTAFGQADQSGGPDKPATECQPFGVLEPFVWLADRRDQLDAENLEQEWSAIRWHFWNPAFVSRVWRDSVRSSQRIPHKVDKPSELFQRVSRIKTKAACLLGGVLSVWSVLLLLTVGSTIGASHKLEFQRQAAIAANPEVTETQLLQVRTWFDQYRLRWHGFLFAPPADEAAEKVEAIDDTLDERHWRPVTAATEEVEKSKHAGEYVARQPNGRHAAEAIQIVATWKAKQARSVNENWLSDRTRQVDEAVSKAKGVPTKDQVEIWKTVVAECQRACPQPEAVNVEESNRRQGLVDRSARALAAAEVKLAEELAVALKEAEKEAQRQRWESFKKVYHQLLEHHAFKDAANHLAKPESRSEDWQKLVKEFPDELHKRVESQVEASLKSNRYDVAHSQLKAAVSASELLELTLRESQPKLAKAILARCSKSLTPISTRIDREQDQTLYAKVIKHRDVSACAEYLAGQRPMEKRTEVQKFHDYLNALNGSHSLTVSYFVTWDKNYNLGDDNIVTVSANGSVVLKHTGYVKAAPGATSGVIGTFPLSSVKLADAVKFSANIVEEDHLFNDDGGSGTATFTIEELRTGQRTFPLRPSDGSNLTNTLILKVTGGFPAEPSLPPWRQP